MIDLLVDGADMSDVTIADVRCSWGRDGPDQATEAGTCSVIMRGPSGGAGLQLGQDLAVVAPDIGWTLFRGRITDLDTRRADDPTSDVWETVVIAAGPLAPLARRRVGDEPWPEETDYDRVTRVLSLVGYDTSGVLPTVASPMLIAADVDNRDAKSCIDDAAESTEGLLWEDHARGRIAYMPAALRRDGAPVATRWNQLVGTWDAQTLVWDATITTLGPWTVPPGAVVRDELEWSQQTEDLVTYARVEYGVEPESGERPFVTAGHALGDDVYERRLSTLLRDQADALTLAAHVVATGAPTWRLTQMLLNVLRIPSAQLLDLPDQLTGGKRVIVAPFPPGSPTGVQWEGYIEGAEHRITCDFGEWTWLVTVRISDVSAAVPATRWNSIIGIWDEQTTTWDALIWEVAA